MSDQGGLAPPQASAEDVRSAQEHRAGVTRQLLQGNEVPVSSGLRYQIHISLVIKGIMEIRAFTSDMNLY